MKKTNRQAEPPAPPKQRAPGRPRSEAVDRALTEAALDEFIENGFHDMSMESIAARAGVSKVSLYRRWNSKLAAVTEVFRFMSETLPIGDNGSLEADIRSLLNQSVGSSTAKFKGKILMRTIGEISGNPELMALYRVHLLAPRMNQLRVVVKRARARKELRADVPVDLACAMIAGPLFLYYLTLLAEAEVNVAGDLAKQLTRAILSGIGK
jgi:AcrR family transcriptional regulator